MSLDRLIAGIEGFSDGEDHARQEIEAALEVVTLASPHALSVSKDDIRRVLADPAAALERHDQAVRDEHRDDLIEHLRSYPNVRIASNGSYVPDAHTESSHE